MQFKDLEGFDISAVVAVVILHKPAYFAEASQASGLQHEWGHAYNLMEAPAACHCSHCTASPTSLNVLRRDQEKIRFERGSSLLR